MIWGFFFCCVITWILEHHLRSCSTTWIRFSSFFDFANGIPGWHFVALLEIRPYFRIGMWDNGSKLHCGYLGSSHNQLLWWGFTPTSTCLVHHEKMIVSLPSSSSSSSSTSPSFSQKKRKTWQHTQIQTHDQKLKKHHLLHLPQSFAFRKQIGVPARRDLTNFWRTCTPAAPHLARPPQFWRSEPTGGGSQKMTQQKKHGKPQFFFVIHKNLWSFCGVEKYPPLTRGEHFPSYPVIFGHL